MIQAAVTKIVDRQNLSRQEAFDAMSAIMSGAVSESLISAFLVGLRMKGETAEEIAGCALAMRQKAVTISTTHARVIDTCGTGGDGLGTFNISTAAAIVASAAGAVVAKHGNRSVSSKSGSADVLKALGVNIELPPAQVSRVLDEVGISFLFAPLLHQAMKFAIPVRKELGLRTVFNILGPLSNPAGAKRQVLGVFRRDLTTTMANVLKELGSEHALVVHGAEGIDEISTFGLTHVSELRDGEVREYDIDATAHNLPPASIPDLQGGTPEQNAQILRNIFGGELGAPRSAVLMNSGAALYVAGVSVDLQAGIEAAAHAIDAGLATKKLNDWIEATNAA